MDEEKRIDDLIELINDLSYRYYTLDDPSVSDVEYDRLYDELLALEEKTGIIKPYSPSQRVGGEVLEGFKKHTHLGNLWSLDKSQSYEELYQWEDRIKRILSTEEIEYTLEYKFDGLTINLTYENGQLVRGATRGNGSVGEDITSQIKTIRSIPLKIDFKGKIEIQGEGLMPLSALENYNKTADDPLKNARNAAAGALRNLDTRETERRNLIAYFYNVGYVEGRKFSSQEDIMAFLKENKIPTFTYFKKFKSMDKLIDEIKLLEEERKKLDVLTDGLVIKVNREDLREKLGYTNRFPRWAIAYKFEAEEMTTRLLDVVWNVGRTAKVTPSAILEPVEIGGATVRRATLNNYDDILRKNLKINSRVLIRRSNDVIPEILGVVGDEEDTREIEKPSLCPACNSELVQRGVHIFCPNSLSCKPQLVSRMVHFASRDAMNIEGFSEKTAEKLIDELRLEDLPEIYEIRYEDLIVLEGFKEKKTQNLLRAIEASKNIDLAAFIYGLGIDNVGIKTARDLADYYKDLNSLIEADYEDLIKVGEVGPIIARSILEFFSDKRILNSLDKLLKEGVRPYYSHGVQEESIFTGKSVVVTGSFKSMKRKEVEDRLTSLGANVRSSVSGTTDYLIVGDKPGSKYTKAMELGLEIISEDDFLKIID